MFTLFLVKHHGNLSFEQILDIARKIRARSLAKDLKGTVLEVLGTCSSIGCSIEGNSANAFTSSVKSGEVQVPLK